MKFSSKVKKCGLSPMRKFHPYAVAAEAKGRKIYHLNIGQPDVETPPQFFSAVRDFSQAVLEYAPSPGMPVLIDAIQKYYDNLNMHFEKDEILITTGIPTPLGEVVVMRARSDGYVQLAAGSIKNSTEHPDADLRAAVTTQNLPFAVEKNSALPQVLIMHTHATESYQTWPDPVFDPGYTARSKSTALNMCAVGEKMAQVLNAAGIRTLHDETLYDAPGYTDSYKRSRAGVQTYLERYPSIKVVLDVHRDAIEDSDGTRVKPVCEIDGESTAQVMVIAGCGNGSSIDLPNWRLNLRFAAEWETAMESAYPGLTRPVLCGYRFYNQDLTTGSLLIEIGGHANTLDEALRAGEYAAKALAKVLGG